MTPTPTTLLWSVLAALPGLLCRAIKAVTRHGAWCLQSLLVAAAVLLAEVQRARHLQVVRAAAVQEQQDLRLAQQEHQAKDLLVVALRDKLLITLRVAAGALAL